MEDEQNHTLDGLLVVGNEAMDGLLDKFAAIVKTASPKRIYTDPKYGDYIDMYYFESKRGVGENVAITYELLKSRLPEKDGHESLCISRSGNETGFSISARRQGGSKQWQYNVISHSNQTGSM